MHPNFLVIGPGRAGTTWVAKNLLLHPEVYIPRRKETRYFNRRYSEGVEWYESFFKNAREKAIGEASVGYLRNGDAAERIHRLIPEVKLISTLRGPVDRAYSGYGRLKSVAKKGEINHQISFEDKLKISPKLVDAGMYAKHLKRYLSLFPKENVLILFYEDLKQDPLSYLKSIYTFLGVDADFVSPLTMKQINATSTTSTQSKILYYSYRAFLRFGFFKVSKHIDSAMGQKPEKMRPETRKMLLDEYFLDDIYELEKLTGRDLSSWRRC